MITSILDQDLYKCSMQQAVMKLYPRRKVKYEFFNRGKTKFPEGFADRLRSEVQKMAYLPSITKSEKKWIYDKCISYFAPHYIDFLSNYKYNPEEVAIHQNSEGNLSIIIRGFWYSAIMWEVPIMALISELYFEMTKDVNVPCEPMDRYLKTLEKVNIFNSIGVKISEFGTRRRYSFKNQEMVVKTLKENFTPGLFMGTSNILLAINNDIDVIGTMAHEWIQYHATVWGYILANEMAVKAWLEIYNKNLNIALPDTFTTDVFLKKMDIESIRSLRGLRQDSGNTVAFTDKVIAWYKEKGIDPMEKTIIYSDNLNPQKVLDIENYSKGKINTAYGIGTNFSNDVGVKPLNMVIKMVEAEIAENSWRKTCKLSDEPGKHTGDQDEIDNCKKWLKTHGFFL